MMMIPRALFVLHVKNFFFFPAKKARGNDEKKYTQEADANIYNNTRGKIRSKVRVKKARIFPARQFFYDGEHSFSIS